MTAAPVTDPDTGQTPPTRLRERHRHITRVKADGSRTGRLADFADDVLHVAPTLVRRGNDTTRFTALPKKRPAERTFASLMHSRRPARDYETRPDTPETVIR